MKQLLQTANRQIQQKMVNSSESLNKTRRKFYTDGCKPEEVEPEIRKLLQRYGAIYETEETGYTKKLSFCGIVQHEETIHVFLPKTTLLRDEVKNKNYAKILLDGLSAYNEINDSTESIGDDIISQADKSSLGQINNFVRLLEDWKNYGIYRRSEKLNHTAQTGEINWSRTVKSVTPFFTRRNVPFYSTFVVNKTNSYSTTIIARIHQWAVAKADDLVGWLQSSENGDLIFPEVAAHGGELLVPKDTAIFMLRRELQTQYNYRKIWLLNTLISVIENENTFAGRHKIYGVKKFWRVWEVVCRNVLQNELSDSVSKLIPQPKYLDSEEKMLGGAKARQIPDILIPENEKLFIVDAKYYDLENSQPGWSDIVKQFYYAKTIKMSGKFESIENFFLFPETQSKNPLPDKVVIRPPSDSSPDKLDLFDQEFSPVRCLYFNVYQMLELFLANKKVSVRDLAVDKVDITAN